MTLILQLLTLQTLKSLMLSLLTTRLDKYSPAVVAASFVLAWAAEAVRKDISGALAVALLAPGDTVLLAPAAASLDMGSSGSI